MLNTQIETKSKIEKHLSGNVSIDGVVVMNLRAVVVTENGIIIGIPQSTQSVVKIDLYNANREACKKDVEEFNAAVDDLIGGAANEA